MSDQSFDHYAASYEQALDQGLALAGESQEHFARERVRWLAECLTVRQARPRRLLDFGCGTGGAIPHLLDVFTPESVLGVDTSEASIATARASLASARPELSTGRAAFALVAQAPPAGDRDLAFCNGVFHHIVPAERLAALEYVRQSLGSGGLFAFWENNPWNPGTRLIMRRIPFDRDAQTISPPRAVRLLTAAGFEVLRTDFLFVFPHALRACRPLERYLRQWPIGGQYQVLCRLP